jgi:predicted dehydrogenase
LAAEELLVEEAGPPEQPKAATGLQKRMKEQPALRRLARSLRAPRVQYLPHGASPYIGELEHFRNLLREGAIESPTMTLDVSLDVMRILDRAREFGL